VTARNWREVSLGEICEFAYGKSLPAKSRSGSGFPVFGSNGKVGLHEEALTDGETVIVGRKGSFGEVHFSSGPCSPIDTTYYITAKHTDTHLPWLAWRLRRLGLERLNRAAAVPGLNRSDAYRQRLLLPPLPEQKRIAQILDAADALRAKRREALTQLDTLLQSIFLEMFGDPVTNPKGWDMVPFDEIGRFVSGATPSKLRDEYWSGSTPWVSPKDMKVSRILDTKDHVSESAFSETNLKRLVDQHLLIVVRGMILAHSFPAAINLVPVAINQDMKAIRPSDQFDLSFLLECVRHLRRSLLSAVSTAAHGTKRFDSESMKKILVPVPPIVLQRRFATIVDSVEQQKARMRAHLDELDTLFASLQSQAFNGEL
jgi:type I restriction enzyme, S subunit